MTSITILAPVSDEILTSEHPLHVSGRAVGRLTPEPVEVDGVAVSVADGSPVQASLSIVAHHAVPAVAFAAVLPALSGEGPHTIHAVATFDNGSAARANVTVVVRNLASAAVSPRESLLVSFVNPDPPASENWAADIVKADRTAGLDSLLSLAVWSQRGDLFPVCAREWVQVGDPTEDYDLDPVGFTGWLLHPELSGGDVPFTHPFGFDWECMVALDQEYSGLLAAGNSVPDGTAGLAAMTEATNLGIPVPDRGLLAVETDGANIPSALKALTTSDTVLIGDRIAVLGRWIVDAGHAVPTAAGGEDSYRAEVHPPLLMAIGGTRPDPSGHTMTRIVLTSRPYLAHQVFTTDTDSIYDDGAANDGTLLTHLNHEADKLHGVIPASWTIEAHPKIASKPFSGAHVFRISVRPPAAQGPHDALGTQVQVSFRFTCRTGVGVEVVGQGDHVDVLVALSGAGYHPPPLPPRQTEVWTKDRLDTVDSASSGLITFEQIASILQGSFVSVAAAEHALAHGVETDAYLTPDVDALNRSHAVPFVSVDQIPAEQGIVVDDTQPYPVVGFLEIRLHRPDIHVDPGIQGVGAVDTPGEGHSEGSQA